MCQRLGLLLLFVFASHAIRIDGDLQKAERDFDEASKAAFEAADVVIEKLVVAAAGALPEKDRWIPHERDSAETILSSVIAANLPLLSDAMKTLHEKGELVSEMLTRLSNCWSACAQSWATCAVSTECKVGLAEWAFEAYAPAPDKPGRYGVVFWTGGSTGIAQAIAAQFASNISDPEKGNRYITLEGSLLGGFLDRLTNPDPSRLFHVDCAEWLKKGQSPTKTPGLGGQFPGRSHIAQRAKCHAWGYEDKSEKERSADLWGALKQEATNQHVTEDMINEWYITVENNRKKLNPGMTAQAMCYKITLGYTSTCSSLGTLWGVVSESLAKYTDRSKVVYSIQRAPKMTSFFWAPYKDGGGEMQTIKKMMNKKDRVRVVVIKTSGCHVEEFYDQWTKFYCEESAAKFTKLWAQGTDYRGQNVKPSFATAPDDAESMPLLNQYVVPSEKGPTWQRIEGRLQVCSLKQEIPSMDKFHTFAKVDGAPEKGSPEADEWEFLLGKDKLKAAEFVDHQIYSGHWAIYAPAVVDSIMQTAPKGVLPDAPYPIEKGDWKQVPEAAGNLNEVLDKTMFECICSVDGISSDTDDKAHSCLAP